MNDAELYRKSNALQRRDTLECLDEFISRIKWKGFGDRVIDLGCADGSITDILRLRMPGNFKRLIGCDISESMVKYANEHYASSRTTFRVLDLAGEIPGDLRRGFDHVFSFYTMHWIQDQERAFQNIYDLLDYGGDCLLLFLGKNPIFDVYRRLSKTDKWKNQLSRVESFISPYHDCVDPGDTIQWKMLRMGFDVIHLECKTKKFVFNDLEVLKSSVSAVNPFNISKDLMPSFLDDYVDIVRDMGLIQNNQGTTTITCSYGLITVLGWKAYSPVKSFTDNKL